MQIHFMEDQMNGGFANPHAQTVLNAQIVLKDDPALEDQLPLPLGFECFVEIAPHT